MDPKLKQMQMVKVILQNLPPEVISRESVETLVLNEGVDYETGSTLMDIVESRELGAESTETSDFFFKEDEKSPKEILLAAALESMDASKAQEVKDMILAVNHTVEKAIEDSKKGLAVAVAHIAKASDTDVTKRLVNEIKNGHMDLIKI